MQKIAMIYGAVVFFALALGFLAACLYARPSETLQVLGLIAGAVALFSPRIRPAIERAIKAAQHG